MVPQRHLGQGTCLLELLLRQDQCRLSRLEAMHTFAQRKVKLLDMLFGEFRLAIKAETRHPIPRDTRAEIY